MAKYLIKVSCTLIALLILVGCKSKADAFFTGRPSEMAMVHNRIIEGSPQAMLELLKVPSRFPDANNDNIADWQHSAVAWWQVSEKRAVMKSAYKKLSHDEITELKKWVKTRNPGITDTYINTLVEIEHSIDAMQ